MFNLCSLILVALDHFYFTLRLAELTYKCSFTNLFSRTSLRFIDEHDSSWMMNTILNTISRETIDNKNGHHDNLDFPTAILKPTTATNKRPITFPYENSSTWGAATTSWLRYIVLILQSVSLSHPSVAFPQNLTFLIRQPCGYPVILKRLYRFRISLGASPVLRSFIYWLTSSEYLVKLLL